MKQLKYRQTSQRTDEIRKHISIFKGVRSWVKYIREGLGMTLEQLSRRTGLSTSTLSQLEKNEGLGKVTLASLKKAAASMDCEVVYALVPRESLEVMRDRQALKKAKSVIAESHIHMEYEGQSLDSEKLKAQILDLKEELKQSRNLWDSE